MKVIHIESGLGNQMLSYCEYLALKLTNPNDDFYLETIIYEIEECGKVICQWNGYELDRIFGIKQPENLRVLFTNTQWDNILKDIRQTEFWNHNWNYPVYFTRVFNKYGLDIENFRGDFEEDNHYAMTEQERKKTLRRSLIDNRIGVLLKRYWYNLRRSKYIDRNDCRKQLFVKTERNLFTGQRLSFIMVGNERWRIDDLIRKTFVFPPFTDNKNIETVAFLSSCNSVAIHARRGDMLSMNGIYYKYGYFRRATKYIRRHVDNPVFIFFTNSGSVDWCRNNESIFGLDYKKDKVIFVDWNTGEESFRDMQLMSYCKHAIITNSSFGWWGAFFINNPYKITISPSIEIDTTHHC